MTGALKVGTRPSKLALKQVEEIQRRLPQIKIRPVIIKTAGDRDKTSPLAEEDGSRFFTREIEEALLSGKIDAAVHSAKDIEESPSDLIIAAVTASISPHECLVSRSGWTLETLLPGAVIGTSSAKRKTAISGFRDDLITKDIRGDIEERLEQLDRGDLDAIIVAHAALIRLGLERRIAQIIPPEIMEPHLLQGRLAIQIKRDRHDLLTIFEGLDEK